MIRRIVAVDRVRQARKTGNGRAEATRAAGRKHATHKEPRCFFFHRPYTGSSCSPSQRGSGCVSGRAATRNIRLKTLLPPVTVNVYLTPNAELVVQKRILLFRGEAGVLEVARSSSQRQQ